MRHLLSGGPVSKLESAVTGLGMRFALGFLTALYFTEPTVRKAIDDLLVSIKNVIL